MALKTRKYRDPSIARINNAPAPRAGSPQTWDLDALTRGQRSFLRDELLCAKDGSLIISQDEYRYGERSSYISGLRRLGVIEVDGDARYVALSLTEDGERWLRSLPVGVL